MLGERKKPKPKARYCENEKCRGWFRPSKYRSAGKNLEYCSVKCLEEVQKASGKPAGEVGGVGGRSW